MYNGITNARIVTPQGIKRGSIIFSPDGTIDKIINQNMPVSKGQYYDAHDGYVLPGLIETHGHFREPGLEHKETIRDGSRAALAGGFTTVFDMPNTKPPTTTVKLLHEQIDRYKKHSYCDFAINFGTSVDHIEELEKVDPAEITGVKVFTAGHQTTPTTIPTLSNQARIWEIAARRGFPVLVHAENQDLVTAREAAYQKSGRHDMLAYSQARNELVVEMAAWEAVILAKYYKTKLWILHASTRGEFDGIEYAKAHGIQAGGEVTGYQLFFTTKDYKKFGTLLKVSPALRSPAVNRVLWQMVRSGVVDGICSEHTPHALSEKQGDIWKAASGMPNIQETVPAFITGWIREFGKPTLEEGLVCLARCASTNVANFFGYQQKSGIRKGNDADLMIIDVDKKWKVKKGDLFTKLRWSVYEGMELIGRPVATFLRGSLVYQQGIIVEPKHGQWIKKGGSA
ncbi:dihydroorotase family protein [Candidatus Gottesmanbacteria bacterium]|nr:dihydroorotase family protein [Candidatus Gottesmanbacteria bacterium]